MFDLADYMAHNRMPAPCLSTKDPQHIRRQQQQASPDLGILDCYLHAFGKYAKCCCLHEHYAPLRARQKRHDLGKMQHLKACFHERSQSLYRLMLKTAHVYLSYRGGPLVKQRSAMAVIITM